jgi:hypothetical protein
MTPSMTHTFYVASAVTSGLLVLLWFERGRKEKMILFAIPIGVVFLYGIARLVAAVGGG